MVDDGAGDESPSLEPRTDSRSDLPRGFRAWQWLYIVKRDETSSPIFSLRDGIYGVGVEVGGASGGAPLTLVDRVWAPWSSYLARIFYYFF